MLVKAKTPDKLRTKTMKNNNRMYKCLANSVFALAIAALAWLPIPAQAQAQEKGAQKLMKIETVEDLQKIDVGDTIVMSCPMCKDVYTQVVVKSFHGASPDELKTQKVHLCSSCDTEIVTKGVGKQAKNVLVHTCKMCGSKDVTCSVMKKGADASGTADEKK
jgi:hypothetical protein